MSGHSNPTPAIAVPGADPRLYTNQFISIFMFQAA